MSRTVYPDCDINKWSVRNNCCELLANADYYYTKDEIDYLLEQVEGLTEEEAIRLIREYTADKAEKSDLEALSAQVASNTTRILNTYTKEETNTLLSTYLTKLKASEMFGNYSKVEDTTLILNSQNLTS